MNQSNPVKLKQFKLSLWERLTGKVTVEVSYGGVLYGVYKVKSEAEKGAEG